MAKTIPMSQLPIQFRISLQKLGSTTRATCWKKPRKCFKNFGEFHPNVARYNNLIEVYAHFEEWDKAQEACDKNLAICMKVLGAEHPYTKRAEEWLDWLQKKMGE
ncbi:MAG: tetratricopeptide repeat protein [Saprospiraceae bacterium]|nr:tetratricopeptide repeat protein [Saprospiraceae bacterium]